LFNTALKTIARLQMELEAWKEGEGMYLQSSRFSVAATPVPSREQYAQMPPDIKELVEERDAWKEQTRALEREIWTLQQKVDRLATPSVASLRPESRRFDFRQVPLHLGEDDIKSEVLEI
jgi:FtsZ-binding cell division protein ZapB